MSASSLSRLNRLRNLRLRHSDFRLRRENRAKSATLGALFLLVVLVGAQIGFHHVQLISKKNKAISNQMEGRNPAESIRQLLEYVQYYPRDAEANYHLGLLLLPEDAPLAAECFGRAVELKYKDISVYRYLGDALWRLRRKHSAEAAYREFLQRAVSYPKQATQVSYVKDRLRAMRAN